MQILYSEIPQPDYCEAALKTIFQIHLKRPPGDVLVFLPGQDDIETVAASVKSFLPDLQKSYPSLANILICPLYARLSPLEQKKAFDLAPPNTRKVILSTNIAETSVTIPGVKYVVDSGMAKEKEYLATVGIDTLVTAFISKSSARQRTGRAGRDSPGVCFRLYTEDAFLGLQESTKPEIQRVSLNFAILHLLASGMEDVWSFQFMDRPDKDAINAALFTLRGLDALNDRGHITPLGKEMASLPLEPVYSRILLSSFAEGCPKEIIDLLSLLGARDSLFINSATNREKANEMRMKFVHRTGDHKMLLNVLRAFEDVEDGERKEWCRDHFINLRAMGQVMDTRKQLIERCGRLEGDWDCTRSVGEESDPVLGACLAGLFANTAFMMPDGTYRHSVTKQPVAIHPGSLLHNKRAQAIMYDELILTSKAYARGVSAIQLSWMKSKAPNVFNAALNGTSVRGASSSKIVQF